MPDEIPETRILEAAIEMVTEHGYAGATTRRIAEAAGVHEVTLFRKFGTKDVLLREAIRLEAEKFETQAVHYTGDLEADLTALVAAYTDLVRRRGRFFGVMMAELPRRPELREVVAPVPMKVMKKITELLGRYQTEGQLRAGPPLEAAWALLSPIVMAGMASNVMPSMFPLPEPREHVRRYLESRRAEPDRRKGGRKKKG